MISEIIRDTWTVKLNKSCQIRRQTYPVFFSRKITVSKKIFFFTTNYICMIFSN